MDRKEYLKKYYREHREAYLARAKKWYHANKEEASAYHKQYYKDNREKCLALSKAWELKNKEKRKAYQKKYHRTYKRKNIDETGLIGKAVVKMMAEERQRKIPDDIDLEFEQFCLLWEKVSRMLFIADFFVWLQLPNPLYSGNTPKCVMRTGGIHKVLHSVHKGEL